MAVSLTFNDHYETIIKSFGEKFFDLAVCDVPYGINLGKMPYLTERNTQVKQKNGDRINARKNAKPYTLKEWDLQPPPQEYFDSLRKISEHQIIFGIDYVNWEGVGPGRIKWDKGVAEGMSFGRYETAYCSMIEDEYILPLLWTGMLQAKSLSEPMTQQGNKKLNEKRIHPCQKPVLLYDAIYSKFGFEGMKVIDTHLGSGSNRISCDKMNYYFVGCEIDKEYFDAEEKRFASHKSKIRLSF